MRTFALVLLTASACLTGCAHAGEKSSPDAPAPAQESGTGDASEGLLEKFDPMLRLALRDKTSQPIGAIARLKKPVPASALRDLSLRGLEILSARDTSLHVRGDTQALLLLSRRDEVVRLEASKAMRPASEATR